MNFQSWGTGYSDLTFLYRMPAPQSRCDHQNLFILEEAAAYSSNDAQVAQHAKIGITVSRLELSNARNSHCVICLQVLVD